MLPARVQFPGFPKFCNKKIVDVAEVNQWRCLEDSGQWLENVDRAHLALTSGKPVLQKILQRRGEPRNFCFSFIFSRKQHYRLLHPLIRLLPLKVQAIVFSNFGIAPPTYLSDI